MNKCSAPNAIDFPRRSLLKRLLVGFVGHGALSPADEI